MAGLLWGAQPAGHASGERAPPTVADTPLSTKRKSAPTRKSRNGVTNWTAGGHASAFSSRGPLGLPVSTVLTCHQGRGNNASPTLRHTASEGLLARTPTRAGSLEQALQAWEQGCQQLVNRANTVTFPASAAT
jgi:hypothetical protein